MAESVAKTCDGRHVHCAAMCVREQLGSGRGLGLGFLELSGVLEAFRSSVFCSNERFCLQARPQNQVRKFVYHLSV